MNESETRAELIDPKFKANGWGVVKGLKIIRERNIFKPTDSRIQVGDGRKKPLIADYILDYKGIKLAVAEAKNDELKVSGGIRQSNISHVEWYPVLRILYVYSKLSTTKNTVRGLLQ